MKHGDLSQVNLANSESCLTRRELLKTVGASAVAAAVGAALPGAFASSRPSTVFGPLTPGKGIKQAVTPRSAAFSLADVQLLEGPFRQAQERYARYLLQLEPDRLLHNFRVNAGLKPKALTSRSI